MSGRENERPAEVIERGPVTLRRYREDDLDALFEAVTESLGHLRPWMPWAADYSRESAQEYLAGSIKRWDDGTEYNYAITTAGTTAGSAALVEQAFRLPGVERVEIVHDALNVASGGIPRKLGFTEVERRPLDLPVPGGSGVGVVWRLTRQVLAAGHNERVQRGDPVAHGEIACLRNAGRRPSYLDTTLYTTLSPCQMCSGAILLFQIPRVVVGEAQTFEGDLGFLAGRGVEIVLLDDAGCMAAMQECQTRYPQIWSEDIVGS